MALVQTRRLRPSFLPPALGRDFFLVGYRVFCRHRTPAGRRLRGLKILRTDVDRREMALAGNLLTHYAYHLARVRVERGHGRLSIEVESDDGRGDLRLSADLDETTDLPAGSPFDDLREARRFAGPMPFTFDFEPETRSVVRVEGRREGWEPRPVSVDVDELRFLRSPPFESAEGRLASCFFLRDVEYRWGRGVAERLPDPR